MWCGRQGRYGSLSKKEMQYLYIDGLIAKYNPDVKLNPSINQIFK